MADLIVTIDGPAASGKSTAARALADRIGAVFLDTGAMYRAVTWACLHAGIDLHDVTAVLSLMDRTDLRFVPQAGGMQVWVDGLDVTGLIRDPAVTAQVKAIAAAGPIRARLVETQRAFAQAAQRIVTEGRDQGTVAFPHAHVKVFLTADPAERARRRQAEWAAQGRAQTVDEVEHAVRQRDTGDQSRSVGPLRAAQDAVVMDTTGLTADQVVEALQRLVTQRTADRDRQRTHGEP